MCFAIAQQPFNWWVFPFITLFGIIFAGVLSFCLSGYREEKFRVKAMGTHPDQPWMWDARWQTDIIPSRSKTSLWGTLAFFVILAMFGLMGVAQIIDKLPSGNFWTLLGVIPVVAAIYFGRQTHRAWKTLRFERGISLILDSRPAWTGSALSARLVCTDRRHADHVQVHLEHITVIREEETDGVNFKTVVDRKCAYQADVRVDDTGHFIANLRVDIPSGSPETAWIEDAEPNRWWDLIVTLGVAGEDIHLRYEVPVATPP
ncbi:hypothetical protein QTO30_16530 [Yoonia sp. GPGPB17]|uniref:hypothetical protein n=1 Tax=Yoonia sp. GPGPB17 TaxID=3026147 RepID=UPI0030C1FA95